MDKFNKTITLMMEKVKMKIDDEGNLLENNTSRMDSELKNHTRELDRINQGMSEFYTEFKKHKDEQVNEVMQLATQVQLETLTAKIESKDFNDRLTRLM